MENTYIEKIRLNNKNTEKNKSLFTEELQGACKICRLDVKNAEQEREYGCKKGRYITSKYSVIYVRPNNRPYNRFGITAGKKIGNAVARNRAKRLIRLAYRNSEVKLPVGIDIVIVARSGILGIKSDEYCGYFNKYGVQEIEKAVKKFSK